MDYAGLGALEQSQHYLLVKILSDYITALVPAGIDTAFLPPGSVLWFGFIDQRTLIIH